MRERSVDYRLSETGKANSKHQAFSRAATAPAGETEGSARARGIREEEVSAGESRHPIFVVPFSLPGLLRRAVVHPACGSSGIGKEKLIHFAVERFLPC